MGSCKTPLQLCGCLSTLSSCWLLSWPRPQDSSTNSNQDSSNNSNQDSSNSSNSSNQGSSNSSSNLDSSSSNQGSSSSNQDSFSNSQDSSSNSQDSSSNSQDSSSNSQGSSSNSQDSSSNNQDSSSNSQDSSHLSKVSHPSKLWTDSDLLPLSSSSSRSHPDQKFSSILRWIMDNVERIMVGSQWSCLMKSSLAPPETS